jgi:hypothetical protein
MLTANSVARKIVLFTRVVLKTVRRRWQNTVAGRLTRRRETKTR